MIALLISSHAHKVELDLILLSPRVLPKYLEFAKNNLDEGVHAQYMCAFGVTSGQKCMEIAKEESELSDDESIKGFDNVRLHPVVMQKQGFTPVTWVQMCSAWRLCRLLALPSFTVDKLTNATTPHIFMFHPL